MRRPGLWRPFSFLALALLLAGCVSFGAVPRETQDEAVSAPRLPWDAEAPTFAVAAEEDATPRLPAALRFPEVWLRPVQDQAALLDAPGATRVEWYVAVQGIHPDVRFVAGRPYVTAEPGKAQDHPAATGALAPGASSALRLHEVGRHVFSVPGHPLAALTLTVGPEAPGGGDAAAFLVQEGEAVRLLPERLVVKPGARVTFHNQADATLEVRRDAFQPWLASGGRALNFTPVDEGLYTLHAEVFDDAGGRGEAQGRFLVDFDRPATRREVALAGFFRAGALAPGALPEAGETGFDAEYPVPALRLWVNASSALPGAASVRAQLLREGDVLGEVLSSEGGALTLQDLPAGRYAVRVLPEEGSLVEYKATARLTYRLPVPEPLREAPGP